MAGLILRITSSDIQDTVRVELLYVERSIWSVCLHDVSAEGFLAQKEYLEVSPRQDVSHVGQEHLCFLLEEVGGVFPTCLSILCSLLHACTESLISPSPRLLLQNCHFSVNRDSSDMYKRLYMDILYVFVFFSSVSCRFWGHGAVAGDYPSCIWVKPGFTSE